jgi:hypothetical protein
LIAFAAASLRFGCKPQPVRQMLFAAATPSVKRRLERPAGRDKRELK